ncbi:MAG: hypothetical protein AB7V55_06515 [Oscillospiraceae bacterium]|jgi:DNA-binding NarL/FixJ family response regulator
MHIAVVDPAPGSALADMARDALHALGHAGSVLPLAPQACLEQPLPQGTMLIFLRVTSMRGVHLARQVARLHPGVPLAFVSNSPEYGMEGYRLGVVDYLLEPLGPADVAGAVRRGLWVKGFHYEAGGDRL